MDFEFASPCHNHMTQFPPKRYSLSPCVCVCVCVPIHRYPYVSMRAWVLSCFSCVQLFVTPWTVACKAPLSMGFSRQEYWWLSCPPKHASPVAPELQVDSLRLKIYMGFHSGYIDIYLYRYIWAFLVAIYIYRYIDNCI